MLTYEVIRRIMTDEKNATKLTALPEDFFKKAKAYLDNKAQISGSKEDAWELDSAKRLLQDLLEIRERKVITLALFFVRSGVTSENMTPEEEVFFDSIVNNIKQFQAERKKVLEGEPEKRGFVAVLEDVPSFVGTDLKNYGPFKKGDVATLPEDNAKLLLEKNLARRIEVKETGGSGSE